MICQCKTTGHDEGCHLRIGGGQTFMIKPPGVIVTPRSAEALATENEQLKLQLSEAKEENVNLREAIRGEREKNAVISQWLVDEGNKLKEKDRLISDIKAALLKYCYCGHSGLPSVDAEGRAGTAPTADTCRIHYALGDIACIEGKSLRPKDETCGATPTGDPGSGPCKKRPGHGGVCENDQFVWDWKPTPYVRGELPPMKDKQEKRFHDCRFKGEIKDGVCVECGLRG